MDKTNTKQRFMYHETLKKRYCEYAIEVSESKNKEKYRTGLHNRFFRSQKFEEQIGKDICEMNEQEARSFLTEFLCGGVLYQINTISTLSSYVEWTMSNKLTSIKENPFTRISVTDIDVSPSYANTMVKDEEDLIESLDLVMDVFYDDGSFHNRETVDNVRLCIFLLIFAGIPFKDLFYIKKECVDLNNKTILYGSRYINISDFLCSVLKTYFQMDELQKVGKGEVEYTKNIVDEGYLISNTKSYGANRDKMRLSYTTDISKIFKECSKKLNPSAILDSGIFHRMHMKEKETGEIDCLEYLMVRRTKSSVINYPDRVKKICKDEYDTWKRAFQL